MEDCWIQYSLHIAKLMLWGFLLSLDKAGWRLHFLLCRASLKQLLLFQVVWREKLKLRGMFQSIRQLKVLSGTKDSTLRFYIPYELLESLSRCGYLDNLSQLHLNIYIYKCIYTHTHVHVNISEGLNVSFS